MVSFVTSSNSTYAARTAAGANPLCPAAAQTDDVVILVITSDKAIDLSPGFIRPAAIKTLSTGQFVDVQVSTVAQDEPGFAGYPITCGQDTTGIATTWNGSYALGIYRNAAEPSVGSWGTAVTTTSVVAPAATAVKSTAMLVECLGAANSTNTVTALTVSSPVTSRVSQSLAGRPHSKVAFGDQQLSAAGSTGTRTTTLAAAQTLGAAGFTMVLEPRPQVIAIGQAKVTGKPRNVLPTITSYSGLIQNSLPTYWFTFNSADAVNTGQDPAPGQYNSFPPADISYVAGLTKGSFAALRGRNGGGWSVNTGVSPPIQPFLPTQPLVYECLFKADATATTLGGTNELLRGGPFRAELQAGLLRVTWATVTNGSLQQEWVMPGSVCTDETRMLTLVYNGAPVGTAATLKIYLDGVLVKTMTDLSESTYWTTPNWAFGQNNSGANAFITIDEHQLYGNPSLTNWTDAKVAARWVWAQPTRVPSNRSFAIDPPRNLGFEGRSSAFQIQALTAYKINRAESERDRARTVRRPGAGPQAMEINPAKSSDAGRVFVTPIQNYVDLLSRNPPTFWFSMDSTTAFNQGTTAATIPGTWVKGVFNPQFIAGITPGSAKALSTSGGGYWKVTSGVDLTQPFAMEGVFQGPNSPISANANKPRILGIPGLFAVSWSTNGVLTISFIDNTFAGGANNNTSTGTTYNDGQPHLLTVLGTGAAVDASSTLSIYVDGVLVKTITTARVPATFVEADFGDPGNQATAFNGIFDEFNLTVNANLATDWTAGQIAQRWSYARTPPPMVTVALGRALEASTSFTPLGRALSLVRASGTTAARTLGRGLTIRRATEADASRTTTPSATAAARAFGIGRATESDVSRTVTKTLGGVTRAIGRATHATTARLLGRALGLRRAADTDVSRTVAPLPGAITVAVPRTDELDTLEEIAPALGEPVSAQQIAMLRALEHDAARAVGGGSQDVLLDFALEADVAWALGVLIPMRGSQSDSRTTFSR